jgi:hypothetical protein
LCLSLILMTFTAFFKCYLKPQKYAIFYLLWSKHNYVAFEAKVINRFLFVIYE